MKKKKRKIIASEILKVTGSFRCGKCGKIVINPKKHLKCPYCEND